MPAKKGDQKSKAKKAEAKMPEPVKDVEPAKDVVSHQAVSKHISAVPGIQKIVETVELLRKDFEKMDGAESSEIPKLEAKMVNELQVVEVLVGQIGRDLAAYVRRQRSRNQAKLVDDVAEYVRGITGGSGR